MCTRKQFVHFARSGRLKTQSVFPDRSSVFAGVSVWPCRRPVEIPAGGCYLNALKARSLGERRMSIRHLNRDEEGVGWTALGFGSLGIRSGLRFRDLRAIIGNLPIHLHDGGHGSGVAAFACERMVAGAGGNFGS